ncbi:glycosyltransferase family 4 protein [Aurantiacibacter hainanensis]|uniref:glycosyltransferase family 4 protein n=1 Tax=Aurantiacibacter hainanensis TaxID=3076114 RepID=UPI0030C71E64
MTQAPRILAVIGSRVLYGQERANLSVIETLQTQGCEILAVVEDHPSFRSMPQEMERRGISYLKVPMIGRRVEGYLFDFLFGNPVRFLQLFKKLRGILRDWRPTHIHVPSPVAFIMADAIAPSNVPIIYRLGDKPSAHNALWRWIWRRIAQRVTHFVADSDFISKNLQEHFGVCETRITVIFTPPAVRLNPPTPDNYAESSANILFIGQISKNKGVDILIEAFKIILKEHRNASLVVVGRVSEWLGDDWARRLRDATLSDPVIGPHVSFVGEQEDIYSFLASAAFLVVPSIIDEAFGLVVGEAKVAARPSVVFPRGGLPEQIIHGEDGYICRDTSVEALADGLRYYLSDPDRVQEHGQNALASISRLGADQFAQRWRAIYDATMLTPGSSIGRRWERKELR